MEERGDSASRQLATCCIALSGRRWAWPVTARFLEAQTYPRERMRLLLLDTSGDEEFGGQVSGWLDGCGYPHWKLERRVFGEPGLADRDRPAHADGVRQACAAIYRYFAERVDTPLVFTLEDDVQPPPDVFTRLASHLGGDVVSASAYYLGRLEADPIAWRWGSGGRPEALAEACGVIDVGGHGFGAAVFQGVAFRPGRFHAGEPYRDFDFNFFHRLVVREGWRAVVDAGCMARHYSAPGIWVRDPRTALPLMELPGDPAKVSIVHLNAYDSHGGGERFAEALLQAQRACGHRSVALVGRKLRADSEAVEFDTEPDLERAGEFHAMGLPDYEFRGSHRLPGHPAVVSADVVHAHNLYGGYFHPFSLIALSQARPVVWTIHDMQPLTGYCSHALDCGRWRTGCGECPDLGRPGLSLPFDNTSRLWRDKSLIADNSRLWLAGGSRWIVEKLRQSLWSGHPVKAFSFKQIFADHVVGK